MKYLLVGDIVSTHGIRGEVKVNIVTDDLSRFDVGNNLYVLRDNVYQKITVSSFRLHKNMALITFNNIKDINVFDTSTVFVVGLGGEIDVESVSKQAYVSIRVAGGGPTETDNFVVIGYVKSTSAFACTYF